MGAASPGRVWPEWWASPAVGAACALWLCSSPRGVRDETALSTAAQRAASAKRSERPVVLFHAEPPVPSTHAAWLSPGPRPPRPPRRAFSATSDAQPSGCMVPPTLALKGAGAPGRGASATPWDCIIPAA